VPVSHLCDALDVIHVPLGIADRLRVQQAGVLVDGLLEIGRVARIDEAGFDAETLEREAELRVGAPVQLIAGDEVLPRGGDGRHRVEDGRHPGGGGHRAGRAMDGRQPFLEGVGGGVRKTGVDVAGLFQFEKIRGVPRVTEQIAGRLIDRHRPRQGVPVGRVTGVERERVGAVVIRFEVGHV